MKFITIINLTVRLIAMILIFVKEPDDFNFAIASQAIGFSFAGMLSIRIAYS